MTTQDKIVRGKLSMLELAEFLNNLSQVSAESGIVARLGSLRLFLKIAGISGR